MNQKHNGRQVTNEEESEVVYLQKEGNIFSDETMDGLRELGAVLRGIHDRLISEGYTIKDGRIYKEDEIQA